MPPARRGPAVPQVAWADLRRLPEATRLAWLAAYVHLRGRALVEGSVELLIETVHAIGARAERRVERQVIAERGKVTGKTGLLFAIADAALARPDETVREVVFPVVGERTLRDLVHEWQSGPMYERSLRTTIRSSYTRHWRRMVPTLPATFGPAPRGALRRPRPAARRRRVRRRLARRDAPRPGDARCRPEARPARRDHSQGRRVDPALAARGAARSGARSAEWGGAQGRDHRGLADDQPARHRQGDRPAARVRPVPCPARRPARPSTAPRRGHGSCSAGAGWATRAGPRRMDASREGGPSHRDLVYARRRTITTGRLREAIAVVTNGTLRARDPRI